MGAQADDIDMKPTYFNTGIYTVRDAARLTGVSTGANSTLAAWLILDDIIEQAQQAKPGTGFAVALNGKIQRVYP